MGLAAADTVPTSAPSASTTKTCLADTPPSAGGLRLQLCPPEGVVLTTAAPSDKGGGDRLSVEGGGTGGSGDGNGFGRNSSSKAAVDSSNGR